MYFLLLILIFAVLILVTTRTFSVFTIRIKNGRIVDTKGKVSRNMLDDFEQAVSQVKRGAIVGNRSSRGVKLAFKGDIGEFTQQRLRNIYGIYEN